MRKRKTTAALIKLTRYQEYLVFVMITTLLGFIFSHAPLTTDSMIRLLVVYAANMLCVCFSFMINDVEDAPDDALNPEKITRNPISAGILSRQIGLFASLGVALISLLAFSPLGTLPAVFGIAALVTGFLYSWKVVRLKSIPVIDLISHSMMLAAFQFLCSYFTFTSFNGFTPDFILPLILATSVSMYGELYNEVRDFTYDKMAGITHTATLIGKDAAQILMYVLLSIAGIVILFSIYLQLIPLWFVLMNIVAGIIFLLKVHVTKTDNIQNMILVITGITLSIWAIFR